MRVHSSTSYIYSPVENGVIVWQELAEVYVDMSVLHGGRRRRQVGEPVVGSRGVLLYRVAVRLLAAPTHSPGKMLIGTVGTRKLTSHVGTSKRNDGGFAEELIYRTEEASDGKK